MAPRDPQVYTIENGFKSRPNNDEKTEVAFEDALNTVAFGKMHVLIIILCGLTLMSVLNETMGMAFIMPSSQCDLQLTSTDKGFLSAVSFLGIFLSSHLWGYLADTRGRRKIIIYTTFVSNIFTVISCFARDFWPFLILRFLSGIFISGPSATIYAYLGEFTGQKYRSTIISLACMFVGLSAVYLPEVALLEKPAEHVYSIDIRPPMGQTEEHLITNEFYRLGLSCQREATDAVFHY